MKYFAILIFMLVCQILPAQTNSEIIRQAMKDELNRTIDSLSGTCSSPCFLSFQIREGKTMIVSASLGAITQSKITPSITSSSRMLVGSYKLNDENFNFRQTSGFKYMQNIRVPIEPDYWGLRRTLWSSSERLYDSACKKYRSKLLTLNDNGIDESNYVLPDFSEAPVVNIDIAPTPLNMEQIYWEGLVKRLSSIFNNYPEISTSSISVSLAKTTSYFLNSEGSSYTFPATFANLNILAGVHDKNNPRHTEMYSFSGLSDQDFPSEDSLRTACLKLIRRVQEHKNLDKLTEEYSGPVLFEGEAAANLILGAFFRGGGLIASREPIAMNSLEFRYPEEPQMNSMQSKIGKQIVSDKISIQSLSHLKEYKGKPLWGSFEVDAEGVIPPAELTLVENGVLKTLLNGRTPGFGVLKSNGHNRLKAYRGKSIYPGVIKVSVSETRSVEQIKEKLLSEAAENGDKYAFIVRQRPFSNKQLIYRIDVENGEETEIRIGNLQYPQIKDFKRTLAFSQKEIITNLGIGGIYGGLFTSMICPDAILLKEVKIWPTRPDRNYRGPTIESPLSSQ